MKSDVGQWPGTRVTLRPIGEILPYARNARTHSPAQVAKIKGSMAEFGFVTPLLVDENGVLIAGHGRLLAAHSLGFTQVPVMVAEGWTPAQVRAYRITDNQLTLLGGWDMELLEGEIEELQDEDYDLSLLGFDDDELQGLLALGDEGVLGDGDGEVGEPPAEPVSRVGDLWLLGEHRLLCGDSLSAANVERLLDGSVADLIVTSPPYNQKINTFSPSGMHKEGEWVGKVGRLAYFDNMPEDEYQGQQQTMLGILFNVMKDGGSLFYNHKNRYRDKSVVSPMMWIPGPFTLRQEIIWRRPGSVTQNARMFLPCDERIYWMYKGKDFLFNDSTEIKTWSTVWDIAPETNREHAVAFPSELPLRCILACSNVGDLVLDPYCGSGTTLITAEKTSRVCYGMEISPGYVDVVVKRWESVTGKHATLDGDGRTSAEVAAKRGVAGDGEDG